MGTSWQDLRYAARMLRRNPGFTATAAVFASAEAVRQGGPGRPRVQLPFPEPVQCGSTVTCDGRLWKVVNTGETAISLLSDEQAWTELPLTVFASLIDQDHIRVAAADIERSDESTIRQRLASTSESDLRIANHRALVPQPQNGPHDPI